MMPRGKLVALGLAGALVEAGGVAAVCATADEVAHAATAKKMAENIRIVFISFFCLLLLLQSVC
jgi:hypothetical protein